VTHLIGMELLVGVHTLQQLYSALVVNQSWQATSSPRQLRCLMAGCQE